MLPTTQPAGLGRRLGALTYDLLIQLALFFLGTALLLPFTGGKAIAAGSVGYSVYLLAISLGYNAWCWIHGGQTVGLKAWRLTVVRTGGGAVGWRQACVRFGTAWLSMAALGLGYGALLLDKEGRTWHDRLSGTRTVWQTS